MKKQSNENPVIRKSYLVAELSQCWTPHETLQVLSEMLWKALIPSHRPLPVPQREKFTKATLHMRLSSCHRLKNLAMKQIGHNVHWRVWINKMQNFYTWFGCHFLVTVPQYPICAKARLQLLRIIAISNLHKNHQRELGTVHVEGAYRRHNLSLQLMLLPRSLVGNMSAMLSFLFL